MPERNGSTALVADFNGGRVIELVSENGGRTIRRAWKMPDGCAERLLLTGDMSGAAFGEFCSGAGIPRGADVIAVMPARFEIVRGFALPGAPESEVENMIAFEARERLPYPQDIWQWSHDSRPAAGGSGTEVTLYAVRRDAVENCILAMRGAGLPLKRIYPWSACSALLSGGEVSGTISALVCPEDNDITIAFYSSGKAKFLRALPRADSASLPAELAVAMDGFAESGHARFGKTSLLGNSREAALFDTLRKEISDIETLDWNSVRARNIDPGEAPGMGLPPAAAAAALAIWLYDAGNGADLIPRMTRKEYSRRRKRAAAALCAIALVLVMAAGMWAAAAKTAQNKSRIKELETNIAAMSPRVEKLNELRAQLSASEPGGGVAAPLDVMKELSLIIPEGEIKITRLYYEKAGKAGLSGQAVSHEKVMLLTSRMDTSKVFREVRLDFSRGSEEFSRKVVNFEITAELARKGAKP